MRCRRANRAIVDRGLGLLSPETAAGLQEHLDRCPACAATAIEEARIVVALAALRRPYAGRIDVVPRVMGEVVRLPRLARTEVPGVQLGWASAVAILIGLALVAGLVASLPSLPRLLEEGRAATAATGAVWNAAVLVLFALLVAPLRLLGALLDLAGGLGAFLGGAAPIIKAGIVFCSLVMATTIAAVVSRDLIRGKTPLLSKEH